MISTEDNFERAKKIINTWPDWKRNYKLTSNSPPMDNEKEKHTLMCECEDPVGINEGHITQNLQTCQMIMGMIQDHLMDDNALACKYPELKDLAEKAQTSIMEIYQKTGCDIDNELFGKDQEGDKFEGQ